MKVYYQNLIEEGIEKWQHQLQTRAVSTFLNRKISFLKENFVFACQNGPERLSMKSWSPWHRCPLCFLWGPLTQPLFPIYFLNSPREQKTCQQCTGYCYAHNAFFSLITSGCKSKWKLYIFWSQSFAEQKSRWWRKWGLLACLVWKASLIQGSCWEWRLECSERHWFPRKERWACCMVLGSNHVI